MKIAYLNKFKKWYLGLAILTLIVSCSGSSDGGGVTPDVSTPAAVFTIKGVPSTVGIGAKFTLNLQLGSVDITDTSGKLITGYDALRWFSSNVSVATVGSSTGEVTAVAKGDAEIHAFLTKTGTVEAKVASVKVSVGAKDLADLTAFNYGTLNASTTKYEVDGLIESSKSLEFNLNITGLLGSDTPSQAATYAIARKDGTTLPTSVSIGTDGKITVTDTFRVANNGTYVITATAKPGSDYAGTKSVEVEFNFRIAGLSISYQALTTIGGSSVSGTATVNGLVGSDTVSSSITFQSITKKDGSAAPASITLDVTTGEVTVSSGAVSADSGEYKVIAVGKGNYSGAVEGVILIVISSASDPDISGNIGYGDINRIFRAASSTYPVTDGVTGNGVRIYSLSTSLVGVSINDKTGALTVDDTIGAGSYIARVEVVSAGTKGSLTTDVNIVVTGQDLIAAGVSGSFRGDLVTTEGTGATSGVTLTGLPAGSQVSSAVSFTISKVASGGSIAPVPASITIDSDGLVSVGSSAIASDSGSYRVEMKGKGNYTGTRGIDLTITVNPPPKVEGVILNGGISGLSKEYGDAPFIVSSTVNAVGGAAVELDWTSSDTAIATVTSSGEVTIKSDGSVDITATAKADSSKSATVNIAIGVRDISKLGFQSYSGIITTIGVAKSSAVNVALVVNDDVPSSLDFSIAKADGSAVPASVTVGLDGSVSVSSAVVKADEGSYIVRVSGKGKYSGVELLPIALSVQLSPSVTSVEINGGTDAVSKQIGDAKFQVASSVVVVDGASQDLGWTSSDEGVATVSVTGEVTVVGVGTSVIKGTSGYDTNKSDDFTLTVTGRDVSTLKVAYPNDITTPSGTAITGPAATVSGLAVGSTIADNLTFSATGLPTGATLDPATGVITLADSVAVGSSTVTVTYTGKKNYSGSGTVNIGVTVVSTTAPAISGTISYVATNTEYGTEKKVSVTDGSTGTTGAKNFVIKTGVAGVTIDPSTGELTIASTVVAGAHSVTVGLSATGNSGELTNSVVLTVTPKDISGFTYTSTDTSLSTAESQELLGSTPTVSGMINGDTVLEAVSFNVVRDNGSIFGAVSALSDGTIKISSAIQVAHAGRYRVQMIGKGSYTGTKEIFFDLVVTGRVASVVVNGGQAISKSTVDSPFTVPTRVVVSGGVSSAVTFSSSDTSVATIDANGLVTIVSGGSTEIRITSVVNPLKTSAVTMTVRVVKINLNTDANHVVTLSTGLISNVIGTDHLVAGPTVTHPQLAGKTAQLGGFSISRTDNMPMAGGVSIDVATGEIKVAANATQLDRGIYQIRGRVVDTDPDFTGSFISDTFVIWPTDLNQKNIIARANVTRDIRDLTLSMDGKNVVNNRVQVAERTLYTRFYGYSAAGGGVFWDIRLDTFSTATATVPNATAVRASRFAFNQYKDNFYVFSPSTPIIIEEGEWVQFSVNRQNAPYRGQIHFELHGLKESEISVASVELNGGNNQLNKEYGDAPFKVNSVVDKSFTATGSLDWTSADPTVATVDAMGEVTLLAAGNTEITAVSTEDNTKSDKINLIVNRKNISSITSGIDLSYGKDIVTSQGTAITGEAMSVIGFTTTNDTVSNSLDLSSIIKKGGVADAGITVAVDGKVTVAATVTPSASGVYVVTATGKGNYSGTKDVELNIVVKSTTAPAITGSISYGTANTVSKPYNSPQTNIAVTDNLTATGTKSYFIKSATPWATIDGLTGELTILQTVPFGNNTVEVGVSSSGNSDEITQTVTVGVTIGNVNTVAFSYPSAIRKTDANAVSSSAPVLGILPSDVVTTEFTFAVVKESTGLASPNVNVGVDGIVTVAAAFSEEEAGSYSVKLTGKGVRYSGDKTLSVLINVDTTVTGIKVNGGNNLQVTHSQPTDIPAMTAEIEGINVDVNSGVTWKSVDPSVVSVDATTGVMRSHKLGSTFIVARSIKDPTITQSQLVTVLGQISVSSLVDFYRHIERYPWPGARPQHANENEAIISATNGIERVLDGITGNLPAGTIVSSVMSFKLERKEARLDVLITNVPASISITADGKLKISASAVPADSGYYRITASSDDGYFSGTKQDSFYIQIEDPSWGDRLYVVANAQNTVRTFSGTLVRGGLQVGEDINPLVNPHIASKDLTGGGNIITKEDHSGAGRSIHYTNGGTIHRIFGRANNFDAEELGGLPDIFLPRIQLVGTRPGDTTVTWQSYYAPSEKKAEYSTVQYEAVYTSYHLISGDGVIPPNTEVRMAFTESFRNDNARGGRYFVYGPKIGAASSVSLSLGADLEKAVTEMFTVPYTLLLPATGTGSTYSRNLTWTTSDANIVSVDASGQATVHQVGEATLTATLVDDSAITATVKVTGLANALSSIEFTRWYKDILVESGQTDEYSLVAPGYVLSAIADYTLTKEFGTLNSAAISVDSSGTLKVTSAVSVSDAGFYTVTAGGKGNFFGSREQRFRLDVAESSLESVDFTYSGEFTPEDNTAQLTAGDSYSTPSLNKFRSGGASRVYVPAGANIVKVLASRDPNNLGTIVSDFPNIQILSFADGSSTEVLSVSTWSTANGNTGLKVGEYSLIGGDREIIAGRWVQIRGYAGSEFNKDIKISLQGVDTSLTAAPEVSSIVIQDGRDFLINPKFSEFSKNVNANVASHFKLDLSIGESFTPSVLVSTKGGASRVVSWSSSDSTVLSIDVNTGESKLLKPGRVTITATSAFDSSKTGTAEVLVYQGVDVGGVRMIYPQMVNTTSGATAVSVTPVFVEESKNNIIYGSLYDKKYLEFSLAGVYENGAITTAGSVLTGVSVDAATGVLTVSGASDTHNNVYVINYKSKSGLGFAENVTNSLYLPVNVEVPQYKSIEFSYVGEINSPNAYRTSWYRRTTTKFYAPPVNYLLGANYAPGAESANIWQNNDGKQRVQLEKGGKLKFVRGVRGKMEYSFEGGPVPFPELELLGFDSEDSTLVTYRARLIGGVEGGGAAIGTELGEGNYHYEKTSITGDGSSSYKQAEEGTYYTLSEGSSDIPVGTWLQVRTRVSMNYVIDLDTAEEAQRRNHDVVIKLGIEEN